MYLIFIKFPNRFKKIFRSVQKWWSAHITASETPFLTAEVGGLSENFVTSWHKSMWEKMEVLKSLFWMCPFHRKEKNRRNQWHLTETKPLWMLVVALPAMIIKEKDTTLQYSFNKGNFNGITVEHLGSWMLTVHATFAGGLCCMSPSSASLPVMCPIRPK